MLHNIFFDDDGPFAYHSAVHDAFGYLQVYHKEGPGYDYLENSLFGDDNKLAGQVGGGLFWTNLLDEIKDKERLYLTF